MPHKFSKEAKEFEGGPGNYFGFGVHEVAIGLVTEGETESGTNYIEFTVLGENEEEDTTRIWLTEKSEKYSFATLRQIYVHCAPADKKDQARESFDNAMTSTEIVELFQNCLGKKIWFTKYWDPERTYKNAKGEIKRSINKTVYGFEPKLKPELMPKDADKDQLNETFKDDPGEPASDIAKDIPKGW